MPPTRSDEYLVIPRPSNERQRPPQVRCEVTEPVERIVAEAGVRGGADATGADDVTVIEDLVNPIRTAHCRAPDRA
jgi:hypothetical protein